MDLDEYNSFVLSFVDQNEYPVRDNPLLYNESIKLQISEISSDKHLKMDFPEFLEGMCRAIDKLSPAPPDEKIEDWPFEKRFEQPLINKLENIIHVIIKGIKNPYYKNIKEKFPPLIKDPATELYILDYQNNPFYEGFIIKNESRRRSSVFNDISRKSSILEINQKRSSVDKKNINRKSSIFLQE